MFAYRFIKIDFESVANYYYFNAGNEEQKAIERLRLVLVDGGIEGFIEDDLLKIMETIGEWKKFIDIFIPSYHRSDNLKTVKYFLKIGWSPKHIHVFVDDETDDIDDYRSVCDGYGVNLHIFNMTEARARYDYIHRPSESRRSAGQARNMFYDIAKKLKISFYMVQDDDTQNYEIKKFGKYKGKAPAEDVKNFFGAVRDFMLKRKIGCFGISQTGDFIGGSNSKILRNKVMNTTFINTEYMYRGERAVQDNDTSQFVGIMNEGFFTGSVADGLVLQQTTSAKAKGGVNGSL